MTLSAPLSLMRLLRAQFLSKCQQDSQDSSNQLKVDPRTRRSRPASSTSQDTLTLESRSRSRQVAPRRSLSWWILRIRQSSPRPQRSSTTFSATSASSSRQSLSLSHATSRTYPSPRILFSLSMNYSTKSSRFARLEKQPNSRRLTPPTAPTKKTAMTRPKVATWSL